MFSSLAGGRRSAAALSAACVVGWTDRGRGRPAGVWAAGAPHGHEFVTGNSKRPKSTTPPSAVGEGSANRVVGAQAYAGVAPAKGMNHGPLRVFTGNAHPDFAREIASEMGVPLSSISVSRFNSGEVSVVINESVRDCDVFVIQPTCNGGAGPQENLMELLIMLDAIRRGAANRVTAVMPFYGYARQNAKEQSRSPITARLVTDLLGVAGANRVLTVELHASQIQGFASYPVDNMYALPLLAEEIERQLADHDLAYDDLVVVSPDVGGAKRASAFARKLNAPLAIFSRQRRRVGEATEIDLVGEVAGKTCVIIDDIADSCDTLCVAATKLKARGASAVIGAIVHGVFSEPAMDKIMSSEMDFVIVTDTIPLGDKAERCPKLKVVSLAPLLAAAIERIHSSQSLSALFENVPRDAPR